MTADTAPSRVHVMVRAHWLNAAFLAVCSRPYVRVDGVLHPCHWTDETVVAVEPGEHTVETFIRYRGTSKEFGTGRVAIDAAPGADVRVLARNGWMNHTPFTPVLQGEAA